MIRRFSRGVALPETALVIGFALLAILGAAQLALIGFAQVSADGAAFIAAHARASDPAVDGVTAATSVFKQFAATNFTTPSPQPKVATELVQKSVSGFTFPGLSSAFTVKGADVEYALATISATPAPYTFSVTAALANQCDPTGNCSLPSNYSIALAQGVNSGNGNGVNGVFSEWQCHQQFYASIHWPSARPQNYSAIKDGDLDPKNPGSHEWKIYQWDGGSHNCNWGGS